MEIPDNIIVHSLKRSFTQLLLKKHSYSPFSGHPTLGQTGQSYSLDQSAMSKRPDTLKTINLQPSIEEDGESAGKLSLQCFLRYLF